jgi:hypothetical protein
MRQSRPTCRAPLSVFAGMRGQDLLRTVPAAGRDRYRPCPQGQRGADVPAVLNRLSRLRSTASAVDSEEPPAGEAGSLAVHKGLRTS